MRLLRSFGSYLRHRRPYVLKFQVLEYFEYLKQSEENSLYWEIPVTIECVTNKCYNETLNIWQQLLYDLKLRQQVNRKITQQT